MSKHKHRISNCSHYSPCMAQPEDYGARRKNNNKNRKNDMYNPFRYLFTLISGVCVRMDDWQISFFEINRSRCTTRYKKNIQTEKMVFPSENPPLTHTCGQRILRFLEALRIYLICVLHLNRQPSQIFDTIFAWGGFLPVFFPFIHPDGWYHFLWIEKKKPCRMRETTCKKESGEREKERQMTECVIQFIVTKIESVHI